jgi:hypothetical protein
VGILGASSRRSPGLLTWPIEATSRSASPAVSLRKRSLRQNRSSRVLAFGVNALQTPVLDFSFQVVEVEGKARSKLGVLGGKKSAFVCGSCQSRTLAITEDSPTCCSQPMKPLLAPVDGLFDVITRRQESRERVRYLGLNVADR